MSFITFVPCPDASALRTAFATWLAVDPVPFALACGVAEHMASVGGWAGVITCDGKPMAAVVQTPPHPVILAAPGPVDMACVDVIAVHLQGRAGSVHAINALFTDLANPISNRLYARIGFVPCLDQTRLTWNIP